MNNGISDELKQAFPNTIPVQNNQTLDPDWLAGLTDGHFYAHVYKKEKIILDSLQTCWRRYKKFL